MNAHLVSRVSLVRTAAVAATSLALILTGAVPAQADSPALIDIPDAGLRSCLTKALTRQNLPTDLTAANLASLSLVACDRSTGAPISDLTGVEHLTGADMIFLTGTDVTNLGPVSGLTGLTQFLLETSGAVDTAPLANLTALYGVGLRGPKITDVSFLSSLGALDALELGISPVASLAPVSSVSSLTRFSFNTTDSVLPSVTLPSGVTKLSMWAPNLTSLATLPHAADVRTLSVNDSPALADLSGIENLSGLRTLSIPSGSYSSITPLAQLSKLEDLQMRNAAIKDLTPLASLASLTTINLSGNQITDLTALSGLPNLVDVNLSYNKLSTLNGLPDLTTLNVVGNRLSSLGSAGSLARLTGISASGNDLTSIDALSGARLSYANLDSNRLTSLKALASAAAGAHISVRWNALRDLSPLPDDAVVAAYGQAPVHLTSATVGKAFDLGLRDVAGTPICPTYPSGVRCSNGAVTYPRSGTYVGEVNLSKGSFTLTVTQHAGPDRRFTKTYAPHVSGRPTVDSDVAAFVRAWSPQADFTYRWYRDGKAITTAGATDRIYHVTAADRGHKLSVCAIGRRDGFRDTRRCSKPTKKTLKGTITQAPRPKVSPHGTVSVGTTLSARAGRWQAGVKLHYQWLRNGRVINGATASTYRVRRGDRSDRISVQVKGTKAGLFAERLTSKTIRVR